MSLVNSIRYHPEYSNIENLGGGVTTLTIAADPKHPINALELIGAVDATSDLELRSGSNVLWKITLPTGGSSFHFELKGHYYSGINEALIAELSASTGSANLSLAYTKSVTRS